MQTIQKEKGIHKDSLLRTAFILSIITIIYNLIEGTVSTWLGSKDETIALFGFGVDSFVEVISGTGIAHMIWRMQKNPISSNDKFERQALRITGTAFYLLTAGLTIGAIINLIKGARPETTLAGIIISILSIVTMYVLYFYKLKTGKKLDSAPIVSDAQCTKTCFYLSFILLASSLAFELFQVRFIDAIGSLGIAWFAFREGNEAFEKVKNNTLSCNEDNCCK